jgi:hypothetical protein
MYGRLGNHGGVLSEELVPYSEFRRGVNSTADR